MVGVELPGGVSLFEDVSLGVLGMGLQGEGCSLSFGVSLLARSRWKSHLMIRAALAAPLIGYPAFLQQLQWVLCFPSLLMTLPPGRGRRLRMTMMTYSIAEAV